MMIVENFAVAWLILGVTLIILEVSLLPGVGLLFAGLAAVTTNFLLEFNIIEHSLLIEIAVFAILTAIWAAILWIPLKRYSKQPSTETYTNMVGSVAYVEGKNLSPNEIGNVKWSGTTMRAKLAENATKPVLVGEAVKIIEIKENILYVTK